VTINCKSIHISQCYDETSNVLFVSDSQCTCYKRLTVNTVVSLSVTDEDGHH